MPLLYLRRLTGPHRTEPANRHLARYLAFIAGATNAGGFLAVHQGTSHLTGIISAMADNLALGSLPLALKGLAAVLAFLLGAFLTTLGIRWARAHSLHSQFALPLLAEALLLVIFGTTGRTFTLDTHHLLATVLLLCFTMGLQNATITKLSNAVIRTTHLTGMVTDIGIALGRIASAGTLRSPQARHQLSTVRLLASLITLFFVGGVTGALGFKHVGFLFTLPLAAILLVLAVMPILDDLRRAPNLSRPA